MALEKTIKIRVPTAQIKYIANKMKIDYEQVKDRMLEFLEYIQEQMITELILWINIYVPVRTGQTAWYLIDMLKGSNIYKNILRIVLASHVPYAEELEEMEDFNVQHFGERGYVYYPNRFGIRGPVVLYDPQAKGHYFTELVKYAQERAQVWISRGINKYFGRL